MKLLGERNRYLPRWLEWLPRLDHGEATPHQGEPVADDEPLPAAA
jgi:putative drug exporter of the RND superfamily